MPRGSSVPCGAGLGRDVLANAGVMVSQEIPFPGKLKLKGDMASREAQAEFQQYQAVQLAVISRLKQAYYRLQYTYAATDLLVIFIALEILSLAVYVLTGIRRILLDDRGFVCEGSGENIYLVREGEIVTPGHASSILDGINRKSVIQIARDLGYTVVERDVARAELYLAEEVFLTGTAAELVPVREIDDHDLGEPGEITRVIQGKFDDALNGRLEEYREWLDPVGEPTGEAPREPTPAEVDAEEVGEPASGTLGS